MHDVLNDNIEVVGLCGLKTIKYLLICSVKHYNELKLTRLRLLYNFGVVMLVIKV